MLDIFRRALGTLPTLAPEDPAQCHACSPYQMKNCEALMLGKLLQWLKCNRIWPFPDPASTPIRIAELVNESQTCPLEIFGFNRGCRLFGHMESLLEGITKTIRIPDELVAHISRQAKKSGLDT